MDWNDYPNESRTIPWKPIVIGVGGLVLLFVIVAVIFRVTGPRNELLTSTQGDVVTQIETMMASCENAENAEGCLEASAKDAAQMTGDVAYCEDLEGESKDDCFFGVAREIIDLAFCADIESPTVKTLCEDAVNRKLADLHQDTSFCQQLSTETKRTNCAETLAGPVTTENCSQRGYDQGYCDFISVTEQAGLANDRSLCSVLSEDYQFSCEEQVLVDDADDDGLTGEQEVTYGTDSHVSDTDGDGYSDGTEVEAGYNPNGPGKLE